MARFYANNGAGIRPSHPRESPRARRGAGRPAASDPAEAQRRAAGAALPPGRHPNLWQRCKKLGVVTSAVSFGRWRDSFGQRLEDDQTIRDVPIKFQRIIPTTDAKAVKTRQRKPRDGARPKPVFFGSVIVTNDQALADELSSFSPDFTEPKRHDVDRTFME
jgi:hypothetical protein